MADDWRAVWHSRQLNAALPTTLAKLLAADGYDGFGGISETAWLDYVGRLASRLALAPDATIFDVGCGAGAFLYPWHARGHQVGGLDYAANLVKIARAALPGAEIGADDALRLDTGARYDYVMSHSVFFYFADFDYAARVLRRMIKKARRGVAILDVPDAATRDRHMAERRTALGDAAYARKYAGLDHLYYDRAWFRRVLSGMDLDICVEDQNIQGYAHSPFRFNVFISLASHGKLGCGHTPALDC